MQNGVGRSEGAHDDRALIFQIVRRNRRPIQYAHRDFENRLVDWLGHDLDRPADRILPAHENSVDFAVLTANRFERARRGKLEFVRRLPRFAERKSRQFHLPLHHFLPGLVKLLADPEIRHHLKVQRHLRLASPRSAPVTFPLRAPSDGESGG